MNIEYALASTIYRELKALANWDLVDCSAAYIGGAHLRGRQRARLLRLAKSNVLWERRMAIIATFCHIKRGEFDDTLRVAGMLSSAFLKGCDESTSPPHMGRKRAIPLPPTGGECQNPNRLRSNRDG